MNVPYFRPLISEDEIAAVASTLRSGWLTSGPQAKQFEEEFAAAVGAKHAVALNSCTAALHLATEALGLQPNHGVLVPTMTFAATAEVVRYHGAVPILIDCDPVTGNMDLNQAAQALSASGLNLPPGIPSPLPVSGIIVVHVGGLMLDTAAARRLANTHGLWLVEDAAHAFPAGIRGDSANTWQRCGEGTSDIACFSFYANKTITTGEGGMAVTADIKLAERMRLMSLHGLSHDAWDRYSGGSWDYRITAPGFKYNMTDIAAALGIQQLRKAEEMRRLREGVARCYLEGLSDVEEIALPAVDPNKLHSWHLFPIKLNLEKLSIDRNAFIDELKAKGIGCSVHWRPLHLHPYYQEKFGWRPEDCPVAAREWQRLISLPIFPRMMAEEVNYCIRKVRQLCSAKRRG
jgi:dTDP-4-amino-4,6-dideoxygalactose transaminase